MDHGAVGQQLMLRHIVAFLKLAVGHQVHVDIDALVLTAVNKIVQAIQGLGIQHTGGGDALTLGISEDVGCIPLSVHLMESDHIAASLSQALGALGGIFLGREASTAVYIHTPETGQSAVLKAEILTYCMDKATLAGRLFVFKNEGNIHGHPVGECGHGNITRHR